MLIRHIRRDPSGHIYVTTPTGPKGPGETVDAWMARIAARDDAELPAQCGAPLERLPDQDVRNLPVDRRWRMSWRWDGARVAPDVAIAKQQRLAEVRAERDAWLHAADAPTKQQEEKKLQGLANNWAAWADYKQALRDLPAQAQSEIGALATLDELDRYDPFAALKQHRDRLAAEVTELEGLLQ